MKVKKGAVDRFENHSRDFKDYLYSEIL